MKFHITWSEVGFGDFGDADWDDDLLRVDFPRVNSGVNFRVNSGVNFHRVSSGVNFPRVSSGVNFRVSLRVNF